MKPMGGAAERRPSAPQRIGPYPIIKEIGAGGFGQVFLAKQPNLAGRHVCVKRAHAHRAKDERFVAMFLDETKVLSGLSHEHVVAVIDAGQDDDGRPYLVMEYVRGTDLAKLLRTMPGYRLPAELVAYVMVQVAQGLAYAHGEAVIHRDIKPANILVGVTGAVKITDLGIAKIQSGGAYAATITQNSMGSEPYMAPELLTLTDSLRLDHRADLWALGVLGWESLCGFRPFEDDALGPRPDLPAGQRARINVLSRPPRRRSIHDVAPDAPKALRDVIEALIAPIEERLPTADEVVRRLVEAGLGLPTHRSGIVALLRKDTLEERPGYREENEKEPEPSSSDADLAPAVPAITGITTKHGKPAAAYEESPDPVNQAAVEAHGQTHEIVAEAGPPAPSPASASPAPARPGEIGAMQPGDRFGEWTIDGRLGAGGMAVVYAATRTSLGKQRAALKVIRPEYSESPDFVARFHTEAVIALGLNHQNVVHVLDAGQIGGVYFLAMEYVDGCDVDSLIEILTAHGLVPGRRLPSHLVVFLALEVARGLAYAHARGVVHRDLTPHNIMVSDEGEAKITDWGVAKPMSADGMASRTQHAIGKPHYMPPEQFRGDPIDGRADLFAVGGSLYELLAGASPFAVRGTPGESVHMLVKRVFENDRPPIAELAPDAPPQLLTAIELLLELEREKRMSSAEELVAQLEPLVHAKTRRQLSALVRAAKDGRALKDESGAIRATVLEALRPPPSTGATGSTPQRTLQLPTEPAPAASEPALPAVASNRTVLWAALGATAIVLVGLLVFAGAWFFGGLDAPARNVRVTQPASEPSARPTQGPSAAPPAPPTASNELNAAVAVPVVVDAPVEQPPDTAPASGQAEAPASEPATTPAEPATSLEVTAPATPTGVPPAPTAPTRRDRERAGRPEPMRSTPTPLDGRTPEPQHGPGSRGRDSTAGQGILGI